MPEKYDYDSFFDPPENPILINCGERKVQTTGRIAIKDIIDRHDIKIGDVVEVYIKKIEGD